MFDCACFRTDNGPKPRNSTQGSTMQAQEECGCGIVFGTDPSGSLACRSFVPGGPAESSGLVQKGDILASVDGCDVLRKPVGQVAPLLLGKAGSRVRLGLQRNGTYLVVELERRPSTPAGALTAFMGAMGNGEQGQRRP
mmetsp:Transcript_11599/g.23951  ORF Transcript_11599/g.23951 Transcript_11599/m.23951 type:complete len:139 (-) Transcript_11599:82-498(-)